MTCNTCEYFRGKGCPIHPEGTETEKACNAYCPNEEEYIRLQVIRASGIVEDEINNTKEG